MKKIKIGARLKDFIADLKANPDALKSALFSVLVPGLGQLRNKQKSKFALFFSVFMIMILVEVVTGGYFYMFSDLQMYPARPTDMFTEINFIRDYGGIFSKGMWGLITLGQIPIMSTYRGQLTSAFNKVLTWLSADNSMTLMGNGLIALMILFLFIGIWYFGVHDAYTTRKHQKHGEPVESGKQYFKRIWTDLFPYIILLPTLVMVMFFILLPFMFSFLLAFTNYTYRNNNLNFIVKWVGLENFSRIITDPGWAGIFGNVIIWTVIFAISASVTSYVLGMFQALIIESRYVKFKKFFRTILIVPWAIPSMVSLMVFRQAFQQDGLVNKFLLQSGLMATASNFFNQIGLTGEAEGIISWLTVYANANLTKAVIVMVNLWLGAPYFMMLITGVLTTLPKDLYEAAAIDGANKLQSFTRITLPLILRATLPAIVMTFTFNFNNFGAIYFLTGGGPGIPNDLVPQSMLIMKGVPGATDILISWIYKLSFTADAQVFNMAAVYSIIIFVFIGSISVFNLSRAKTLWEDD
jgi:arabinogalactan oligomer / maltooligosaccharide transport system permease protein